MGKRNFLKYIARPTEVVITLILIMFIVFFAQFFSVQMIWAYTYEKPSTPKYENDQQQRINKAEKLFLPDGTIHIVYRTDAQDKGDYTKEEITDVNGGVLWQGIRKNRPFKYLDWRESPSAFYDEWRMKQMFLLTPDLPTVLQVPVRVGKEVNEVWQYDFEREMFAGFGIEGRLIGYLGANGFAGMETQAQPLGEIGGFESWTDEDPSSVIMLWQTKRRLYQIDFRSRAVETIFESAQSDIKSIQWHNWRPMNPKDRDDSGIEYRPLIDCRTADNKRHLIMHEPNQILTPDVPKKSNKWESGVSFTAISGRIFLRYYENNFNPPKSFELQEQYRTEYYSKEQPQSLRLYKIADDGNLKLVNQFDWIQPAQKIRRAEEGMEIIKKWIIKMSPPVYDLLCYLFGDYFYKVRYEKRGMIEVYAAAITELRPHYSSLNYVLSAAMVIFALWHGWASRTSWGKLILWLIIVGAFNLAGLLTYLALNHTPVIKCPICGQKRGLQSVACIRCGKELPIPQRKPTDLILAN